MNPTATTMANTPIALTQRGELMVIQNWLVGGFAHRLCVV